MSADRADAAMEGLRALAETSVDDLMRENRRLRFALGLVAMSKVQGRPVENAVASMKRIAMAALRHDEESKNG